MIIYMMDEEKSNSFDINQSGQIDDDYIAYDEKNARLVGKKSNRSLAEGDSLRARVVAISLNEREPRESKIGLTMRQTALGKLEWLKEIGKKLEE